MMVTPGRLAALVLAPALLLGAAACGGDDDKPSAGSTLPVTPTTPGAAPGTPGQTPGAPGATPGVPGQTPGVPGQTPGAPGQQNPGGGTNNGGGGGNGARPTPPAMNAFLACMRQRGIDLKPNQALPPGTDEKKMREATLACVGHLTATPKAG
ncbi:hypothetical protein [Actinomadura flavalba]|uniref:hypothetical protein n=1 Tax=Actinomadura flavalba TaxID=1120938 RepID=UPI00039A910E|nr:hypothetical protein [Actinomadura flavalba]